MTTRYVDRCSVDGCPAPNDSIWHEPWCRAIKGHKCFGGATHQHIPKKGMGGKNPESKIVACLCAGAHDKIDNGPWGNAVVDIPEIGKVYRIWDVRKKSPLLERVIEPCEEEPDPDEGLELRPEIEERLRQSALVVQEPSAREQLAKAGAKGRQALDVASNVPEVKDIRDRAEALGAYAKAAHLGLQAQNEMADIKIRAERKAGQLLSTIEREPGKRAPTSLQAAIRLAEIGDTMAHRWQLEAEIADLEYEAYAQTCNQEGLELTSAGILRLVRALKRQDQEPEPPEVCPEHEDGHHFVCACGKER